MEAWNPDAEGYYELHEETCYSCQELAEDEKRNKDGDFRRDRIVWVSARDDHPHGKLRPYQIGQTKPS